MDESDGKVKDNSGEDKRLKPKRKKRIKKLKQPEIGAQAPNRLIQPVLEPLRNPYPQQRPSTIANGNGLSQEPRYTNVETNANKSSSAVQTSKQHALPTNQILPINPDPVSNSSLENQSSKFNSQSAWKKAGLVTQFATKPTASRRKRTLEISDVANPDGEAEVYESTNM